MTEADGAAAQQRDPGAGAAREQLTAVAADWAAAIVSDDPERIAEFMADEWVMVSETGVSPRAQFLSYVESGDLTHSAMELTGRPRIQVYGETALFTGRVTNTAHYQGRRFEADEWTTDVFVRRGGRWLCVLSQVTAAR
ncbi:hypothetical protein GCM10012287_03250 [Streptomyces daqingensis]|uniref:DUF4440 domain-containing protein n=1 Tax=Streptomyces daqingensis TaxID=1472640 RepID=A0ABQ2LUH2_9ACTN|nr:nuclear transport factor 2 family protein [Streptomyces daqingensis]GGO42408.1 hypothetical protein GCM10012287_03250 [Streptomyces daqingensis]